jgi:integrase
MTRSTYRKIIVTEETLKNINPDNKKLVERFLREKSIGSSDITIKNYRSDSSIFFTWNLLNNSNKFFCDIKKSEFIDFFSYATDSKELSWGSARANRLRSFISSLSLYIERVLDDEYPNFRSSVLRAVQSIPKDERREKTILTDSQVEDLLAYLYKTNPQQACFVALGIYSGSRFAEVLRFTTESLNIEKTAFEGIFLESEKIKTKGRGKSGKLLNKYVLRDKFLPYYTKWIEERKNIMENNNLKHNSLFIKEDGTPATEGTARSWIASIEKYLGIPFYFHATRHYFCTLLARKKIPQQFIVFIFGWASASMFQIYNDMTPKDMVWDELSNLK